MGYMLANFKRGRGDYAGIAGKLNDGAMIPTYGMTRLLTLTQPITMIRWIILQS